MKKIKASLESQTIKAWAGSLSKESTLTFNTTTKMEAGDTPNPTIETVKKIAASLEVTIDNLVGPEKALTL